MVEHRIDPDLTARGLHLAAPDVRVPAHPGDIFVRMRVELGFRRVEDAVVHDARGNEVVGRFETALLNDGVHINAPREIARRSCVRPERR